MKGLNMGAVETVATMVTAAIGGFIGAAIYRMIRRKR
jgi:LytS/YehU family sensor histidine kinase